MEKLAAICLIVLTLGINSCEPPIINIPPSEPMLGSLNISSEPPATSVTIDEVEVVNATPLTVMLPVGNHTIKLRRQFYTDYSTTVTITANQLHTISAVLVSSFFPYTGAWINRGLIVAPTGESMTVEINLTVTDDLVTGTDSILIGDTAGSGGNCDGKIMDTDSIDIVCISSNEDTGYWRNAHYHISAQSMSKINANTLFIDTNRRWNLSIPLNREN